MQHATPSHRMLGSVDSSSLFANADKMWDYNVRSALSGDLYCDAESNAFRQLHTLRPSH